MYGIENFQTGHSASETGWSNKPERSIGEVFWSYAKPLLINPVVEYLAKQAIGRYAGPAVLQQYVAPKIKRELQAERKQKTFASQRPLHERVYAESILIPETRDRMMTEKDLFPQDKRDIIAFLNAREQAMREAGVDPSKHRSVGYGTVKDDGLENLDIFGYTRIKHPFSQELAISLGKMDYTVDENGNYVITDEYDFKIPETVTAGTENYAEAMANKILSGDQKGAAAVYGSMIKPSNKPGKARKILIRLNRADINNATSARK